MMNILENYLNYLNERGSKWKKKVTSGELSDSSIEKLKKLAKPEKQYMKGINKGTNKILKKNDATKMYTRAANLSGPATASSSFGSTVVLPKGNAKWFRLMSRLKGLNLSPREWAKLKPMIDRHEADEVVAFLKQTKKNKGVDNATILFQRKGKTQGAHAGIDVLKKEKKLHDYISKIYPSSGMTKFGKFRKSTGEYDLASKSKNELNKINKEILRLRKLRQKALEDAREVIGDVMAKKGFLQKAKNITLNIKKLSKASKFMKGVKVAI